MIIMHIIGNLFFVLLLFMNIIEFRNNKKNIKKFVIITFILGCIMYLIYLVMLVIDFKASEFDSQSFSMLILSWAFENAVFCIIKKSK